MRPGARNILATLSTKTTGFEVKIGAELQKKQWQNITEVILSFFRVIKRI